MRENQQCDKCKHYALYHMPSSGKTVCARCQELERTRMANSGLVNGNTYKKIGPGSGD